jgi:hypothetical protein
VSRAIRNIPAVKAEPAGFQSACQSAGAVLHRRGVFQPDPTESDQQPAEGYLGFHAASGAPTQ